MNDFASFSLIFVTCYLSKINCIKNHIPDSSADTYSTSTVIVLLVRFLQIVSSYSASAMRIIQNKNFTEQPNCQVSTAFKMQHEIMKYFFVDSVKNSFFKNVNNEKEESWNKDHICRLSRRRERYGSWSWQEDPVVGKPLARQGFPPSLRTWDGR